MRDAQLFDTGAHPHAFKIAQGTEHRILLIETDDLGQHVIAGGLFNLAQITDTRLGQTALQQHAVDALDTPAHRDRRKAGQRLRPVLLPGLQARLQVGTHQRTS